MANLFSVTVRFNRVFVINLLKMAACKDTVPFVVNMLIGLSVWAELTYNYWIVFFPWSSVHGCVVAG